jgi:hypothetical protein
MNPNELVLVVRFIALVSHIWSIRSKFTDESSKFTLPMWRGHFAAVRFNQNEVPHTHTHTYIYITRLSKIKINKYHLLVSINMNSDIYMVCRCFSNFLRYSFVDVHRDIKPRKTPEILLTQPKPASMSFGLWNMCCIKVRSKSSSAS